MSSGRGWYIRRGREYWTGDGWSKRKDFGKIVTRDPWGTADKIDPDDEDIWIERV